MGTYNVSKIEDWYKDFTSAKNKFTNTYYSDYKNSYIRSCNDSAVVTMCNKLNQHYDRINRINNRIKDVWDDFLYDLKAIDNRLAGGKGSTNDSAVASKLSKLPTLKEYKATLKTRINSASAVVGTVDKIGWSEDRTAAENLDYFCTRAEATIDTAIFSILEGGVKLVEDAVDLLALAGTVVASEYTGMIDLGNLIAAEITGDDSLKTDYTKQMWEGTRAFVSKDYTGQAFDWFYDNTSAGQYMKENAYGFNTVRAIGSEVGEVVGVVALSVVTGGGAAYMYGAAKIAEHTEENWQDENTSTAAGFFKGALQGVGDGIFFGIGMKGDAVMKSAATAVVKEGGKQTVKKTAILFGKTLFECGCSVAQDGTNIMINTLFSDDVITTPDGQSIRFDSFNDKLNYYYEQAGGLDGLITSAATATTLSLGSDLIDINQISKNINTNTAIKNADINTSSTRKSLSSTSTKNIDVSSSSKRMQADVNANNMKNKIEGVNPKKIEASSRTSNPKVDTNTNSLRKEYDQLLNKSKESWFVNAKEAGDNGWAWDLNEVDQADKIARRMKELENTLGIKDTGVPESKIYDYSGAKKEADELARKISKEPIPGYENIDANSQEYKKAMQEMYSKPSPSGKQDLSQFKKQKGNTFVGDKVGGSASDPDVLKKIDELRNAKASNINNSNEFRIIQDEVGSAAADPNVATISDNISKMDANGVNVKNKGNTFVGDKVGGSASDPEVLKKIDELRNTKTSKINNSNEFEILGERTGKDGIRRKKVQYSDGRQDLIDEYGRSCVLGREGYFEIEGFTKNPNVNSSAVKEANDAAKNVKNNVDDNFKNAKKKTDGQTSNTNKTRQDYGYKPKDDIPHNNRKTNNFNDTVKTKVNDFNAKVKNNFNTFKESIKNMDVKKNIQDFNNSALNKFNKTLDNVKNKLEYSQTYRKLNNTVKQTGMDLDSYRKLRRSSSEYKNIIDKANSIVELIAIERNLGVPSYFKNLEFDNATKAVNLTDMDVEALMSRRQQLIKELDSYNGRNMPQSAIDNAYTVKNIDNTLAKLDVLERKLGYSNGVYVSDKDIMVVKREDGLANVEYVNDLSNIKNKDDLSIIKNSDNNIRKPSPSSIDNSVAKDFSTLKNILRGSLTITTLTALFGGIIGESSNQNDLTGVINKIPGKEEISPDSINHSGNQDDINHSENQDNFDNQNYNETETTPKGNDTNKGYNGIKIGNMVGDYNVDYGHDSADEAVGGKNTETLISEYVNESSVFKRFAIVNEDGSIGKISGEDGITLEEFCKENNVSIDRVAVDVADKKGNSLAWVSVSELVS